ncbi:hypothetical protein O6H91_18G010800 [Diphasiastrum complanatum]|uniref:Uncharacterized protein n=1 Tax=Diphasiastrum complanatum TaxID=34168 RepID=A0ACC2AY32_DIPCM|nr:hypothetical protein O6H91_18G010800 [Diphasiastrum complanatum]
MLIWLLDSESRVDSSTAHDGEPSGVFVFGAGATARERKPGDPSVSVTLSKNRLLKQRKSLHPVKGKGTLTGASVFFDPSSGFRRGGADSPVASDSRVTAERSFNSRAKDHVFSPVSSNSVFPLDDYLSEDILGNLSFLSSSAGLEFPFLLNNTAAAVHPTFEKLMSGKDASKFQPATYDSITGTLKVEDMGAKPSDANSWVWETSSQDGKVSNEEFDQNIFEQPFDKHNENDSLFARQMNDEVALKQTEDKDTLYGHQSSEPPALSTWNLNGASSSWFFPENDEHFYEEILKPLYHDSAEEGLKHDADRLCTASSTSSTSCAQCSQVGVGETEHLQASILQKTSSTNNGSQELQERFIFRAVKGTNSTSDTSNVSSPLKATTSVWMSSSVGNLDCSSARSNLVASVDDLDWFCELGKLDIQRTGIDVNSVSLPDASSSKFVPVSGPIGSSSNIFTSEAESPAEVDRNSEDDTQVGTSLSAGSVLTETHSTLNQDGFSATTSPSFVFQARNASDKILKKKKDKVVHAQNIISRPGGHISSKPLKHYSPLNRKEEPRPGDPIKIGASSASSDFSSQLPVEIECSSPLHPDSNMSDFGRLASSWDIPFPSVDSEEEGESTFYFGQKLQDDLAIEEMIAAAGDLNLDDENIGEGEPSWEEHPGSGEEHTWWTANDAFLNEFVSMKGKLKRPNSDVGQVPYFGGEVPSQHTKLDAEKGPGAESSSASSSNNSNMKSFTFSAMSSPTSSLSASRRHTRKMYPERAAVGTPKSAQFLTPNVDLDSAVSAHTDFTSKDNNEPGIIEETKPDILLEKPDMVTPTSRSRSEFNQACSSPCSLNNMSSRPSEDMPSISTTPSVTLSSNSGLSVETVPAIYSRAPVGVAAEQACERWRLRGNQAYANGDFPKAEEYYSRGASSVSPNETSQSCIRASMLCYSNRAATRMVVGRVREALTDCMRAMAVDPSFLRVHLRAASCHLALGETEAAASLFGECLRRSKDDVGDDPKIVSEALEGIRKSQQVHEFSERMVGLLESKSSTDATAALRLLNEALKCSPHSDHLLELKAHALFALRRFEEVIQLCEQSLALAERNFPVNIGKSLSNLATDRSEAAFDYSLYSNVKLWRQKFTAKAYFHLGKLEEALELIQKMEEGCLHRFNNAVDNEKEPMSTLSLLIRDLLRHKAAGNEAFQSGKYAEAIEHYTAAFACNGESRPFYAVLFCNRAAASQALGHIPDAIADCSRAIVLDPKYAKAISRRATLYEMIRDYGQASSDLQRVVTLLEKQDEHSKESQINKVEISSTTLPELKQSQERLAKNEEEFKKGHPRDYYLILGLEPSCMTNEIKKAYRKLALKHHPDKAGQFLVRNDGGEEGSLWKEVGEEVRRDAEQLFKLIGEAHATLSDPSKRLNYDKDEELRKLRIGSPTGGQSNASETFSYYHEKGGRRQRWGSWDEYANQHQRWQNGPDAAQPDTFAHVGRYESSKTKNTGGRWEYDWDDV